MIIWIDAQLTPAIAPWLSHNFPVSAMAIRDLGLRDAADRKIFLAARQADAVVLTKDSDFVRILDDLGPPPRVIWLTCGNTSNARLRKILSGTLSSALQMLQTGEPLVEIGPF